MPLQNEQRFKDWINLALDYKPKAKAARKKGLVDALLTVNQAQRSAA